MDALTFAAASTNADVIPAANVTVSGSGGNRTLTVVPTAGISGEADITITASDGTHSAEKSFHIIVAKVISMDTNLVENGNASSGMAKWGGNTVNVKATASGFLLYSPGAYITQSIDISRFATLIAGGEAEFLLSASISGTYGNVTAQFYSNIACTNPVGSEVSVSPSAPSLQAKIPAGALGVVVSGHYTTSN